MKIIYSHLKNIQSLIAKKHNFTFLSTKSSREYRLMFLTNLVTILIKGHSAVDSEHFSTPLALAQFLKGRKLCDGKLYRMSEKTPCFLMEEITPVRN
jgi:hypothetical protein